MYAAQLSVDFLVLPNGHWCCHVCLWPACFLRRTLAANGANHCAVPWKKQMVAKQRANVLSVEDRAICAGKWLLANLIPVQQSADNKPDSSSRQCLVHCGYK